MRAFLSSETTWDLVEEPSDWQDFEEAEVSDQWGPYFVGGVLSIWLAGTVIGFNAALAVLVALGLGLALIGVFRPVIGIYGVTIVCTVDSLMRTYLMTGGLLRWNTFNYVLLLVMLVAFPLILRLRDYQSGWLRAFLLILTVELYMSPLMMQGINHLLNIAIVIGLQVYFLRVVGDKNALLWIGMISGTVAAAGGALYFMQRGGLARIDENAFSYFPLTGIFGICLAFQTAVRQSRLVKTLMALAVVCAVWLLLIGSRGGMLVGSICLAYLLLIIPGQSRKLVIACAGFTVFLAISAQFEEMRERAFGRVEKLFDTDRSAAARTSGRSDLMLGAWWIFCDHPQGVGTGGFPRQWAIISRDRSNELSGYKIGVEQTCHSGWMKTLAENGIPGTILLLGYVTSFAIVGWVRKHDSLLLIGLMTSLCLALAFVSTEFAGKGLWFLAAGATTLLDNRTDVGDEEWEFE